MLTAKRHPVAPDLIDVYTDAIPAPANVVAKHNAKHGQTWRTTHVGPKPTMAEIRAAVAQVV